MSSTRKLPGSLHESPDYLKGAFAEHHMLEVMWNIAPWGITVIVPGKDPRQILIGDCNPIVCKWHGYSREELIGKSMDFTHAYPWTQSAGDHWFSAKTHNGLITGHALHRHKDDSTFMVDYSLTFAKINGVDCAIGFDYLEDRKSGLEESMANRWITAMESSDDGIWDYDIASGRFWTSPRWQSMLGRPHHPVEFDLSQIIENIHPEEREEFKEQIEKLSTVPNERIDIQCRYRKSEGVWVWINLRGKSSTDNHGVPIRALGSMTDMSARKRAETIIVDALAKAEEANRAKSQFLAVMSHEIRTPLNGVLGMSALLAGTVLDEEQQSYLKTIESSGDALLNVIDEILNFSKLEAGNVELEEKAFNFIDCMHGAISTVSPLAEEKGLELLLSIEPKVPLQIIGDQNRLRQVVINLLGNAIKFTKEGEVELSLKSSSIPGAIKGEPDTQITIEIHDTGIGIPPAGIKKLFEPFSQVDASTTRKYGGTGLGLAICKRLLELMKGGITIESKVGVGSTFRCTTTVVRLVENAIEPARLLKNRRVLIIEDNKRAREILSQQLYHLGIESLAVETGREAIQAINNGKEKNFDCAIVDLNLPEESGLELSSQISTRSIEIPVVSIDTIGGAYSGKGSDIFSGRLTKPTTPTNLELTLIRSILKQKNNESNGLAANQRPTFTQLQDELILIVDDNKVNRLVATQLLKKMGYSTHTVESGFLSIEACKKNSYDIIFMDLQMPEMNGFEALEKIRALIPDTEPQPWIIALTADVMEGDCERCLEAGMDDYLPKPIRPQLLMKALETARSNIAKRT